MHNLTGIWRIWDTGFRVVSSQWDVICDEERNVSATCLHRNETDIFKLLDEMEYVEEIARGGNGLFHHHI
jgi:hypothetical protein